MRRAENARTAQRKRDKQPTNRSTNRSTDGRTNERTNQRVRGSTRGTRRGTTGELRVRAVLSRLSGSALGTESGERERCRTSEGFTATPTSVVGGRWPLPACLPLGNPRAPLPLPRRSHHRVATLRVTRTHPVPPLSPLPSRSRQRDDATLGARLSFRAYLPLLPPNRHIARDITDASASDCPLYYYYYCQSMRIHSHPSRKSAFPNETIESRERNAFALRSPFFKIKYSYCFRFSVRLLLHLPFFSFVHSPPPQEMIIIFYLKKYRILWKTWRSIHVLYDLAVSGNVRCLLCIDISLSLLQHICSAGLLRWPIIRLRFSCL